MELIDGKITVSNVKGKKPCAQLRRRQVNRIYPVYVCTLPCGV